MRQGFIFVLFLVTASAFGADTLKLKITGIEKVAHDNDKDECGVIGLPCHTRDEYKVTARNKTADFVLSCKTDYVSYFKSPNVISYIPVDKPMKVCMVFFHAGDLVTFMEVRADSWIPDDGVKDDAMQPFTITSEKETPQGSKAQ
jgi:hypothetical protein